MLGYECLVPKQAIRVHVDERGNHVVAKWRSRPEGTHRFEHYRATGVRIARAWSGRHRIVVADQQDGAGARRTWHTHQDVLDASGRDRLVEVKPRRAERGGRLDLRLE